MSNGETRAFVAARLGSEHAVDKAVRDGELTTKQIDGVTFYFRRTLVAGTTQGVTGKLRVGGSTGIPQFAANDAMAALRSLDWSWGKTTAAQAAQLAEGTIPPKIQAKVDEATQALQALTKDASKTRADLLGRGLASQAQNLAKDMAATSLTQGHLDRLALTGAIDGQPADDAAIRSLLTTAASNASQLFSTVTQLKALVAQHNKAAASSGSK